MNFKYSKFRENDNGAMCLEPFDFHIILNQNENIIEKAKDNIIKITNPKNQKICFAEIAKPLPQDQCQEGSAILTDFHIKNLDLQDQDEIILEPFNINDVKFAEEAVLEFEKTPSMLSQEILENVKNNIGNCDIFCVKGNTISKPKIPNVEGQNIVINLKVKSVAPKDDSIVRLSNKIIKLSYLNEKKDKMDLDVGGNTKVKEVLEQAFDLILKNPEKCKIFGITPIKSILMYGPPGCGKTLIATEVAKNFGANFFTVTGSEIFDKFYGNGEKKLVEIFDEARKQKSILFIDEIDAFAPIRDSTDEASKKIVNTLLTELNGNKPGDENIFIIGATNRLDSIDPAIKRTGRFDAKILVPLPNKEDREDILKVSIKKINNKSEGKLDFDINLNKWAERTQGFSGSDLGRLCNSAVSIVAMDYENRMSLQITEEDFEIAFKDIPPSITDDIEMVDVSDFSWDDVVTDDLKSYLEKYIIKPIEYQERLEKMNLPVRANLLVVGKSGSGKTRAIKALANKIDYKLIMVNALDIVTGKYGDVSTSVSDLFSKAEILTPSIFLLDNLDIIYSEKSSNYNEKIMTFTARLIENMGRVKHYNKLFLISTVSDPKNLPPKLLAEGGFTEICNMNDISHESVIILLKQFIGDYVENDNLFNEFADKIVNKLTIRQIKRLCDDMKINVVLNDFETITSTDFEEVLEKYVNN